MMPAKTWTALAMQTRGSGTPMILLHGGVGSWTHWIRNIEALADRYRVIAFDLPGYGASPDVPAGIRPEDYIAWVASAIRTVADGGCDLVGFSFGGALAARIAVQLGATVRRLSLLAPGGFGIPIGRSIPTAKMPSSGASVAERRAAVAANLGHWMLSKRPPPEADVVDLQIANIERARFDSRIVSLRETMIADMPHIAAPVQLVWGELDRLAYPSIAARIEACRVVRPNARYEVVMGAGHWVQYEQPEKVNQLILQFHGDLDGPRPDE